MNGLQAVSQDYGKLNPLSSEKSESDCNGPFSRGVKFLTALSVWNYKKIREEVNWNP